MISKSTKLLAAAFAAALAGCNAVEDVREQPFTPVPAQGVVLQGKVTGTLGRQRALTLLNNGNNDNARSVQATVGVAETPFNFGIVPVGSTYNVTIKANPYGKICSVSGGTGTVTTPEALNIVVNCVNDPAVTRYNVRVTFNSTFAGSPGAKVILTTEEGVFEKTPASTDTFVQFDSAVFHNVLNGVTYPPAFSWTVTATNTAGSTPTAPLVNKCFVSNSTNPAGASPTAHIGVAPAASTAWPTVGTAQANGALPPGNPCEFTIGSTVSGSTAGQGVYYSTPPNGTPQTMPTGGLDLQLRDVTGKVLETLTFTGGYGTSGTTATATTNGVGVGYAFTTIGRSNPAAVYDVAVSRQPTGQTCIVHNGGAATLGVATANITNAHVACRVRPSGTAVLRGTYEFRSGVTFNYNPTPVAAQPVVSAVNNNGTIVTTTTTVSTIKTRTIYNASANPDLGGRSKGQTVISDTSTRVVVTSQAPGASSATTTSDTTTQQFDVTSTNTVITRNFLTFFDDGTFLYGIHGNNQVEHGFYNYNPTTREISFTLITDAFTVPFGGTTAATNQSISLTNGLSGTIPSPATSITWGGVAHPKMVNVVKTAGATNTLSGEFGPVDNVTTVGAKWSKWVMAEPHNVAGQMTGTWVSADHRRAWNYDFNTTLGFHVGVNGGAPNMQDGCFTFQDYRDPAGFYTRRGGLTGCLDAVSVPAGIGTVDYQLPTLANTPGFVGRMPGTETAFDGRSPSPIYYAIGTAATFATVADPAFFPSTTTQPTTQTALTTMCGTADVLGVRASLNGNAINTPVYFCREKVN